MALFFRNRIRVGPFFVAFTRSAIEVFLLHPRIRVPVRPRMAVIRVGADGLRYLLSFPRSAVRPASTGKRRRRSGIRQAVPEVVPVSAPLLGESSGEAVFQETQRRHATPAIAPWAIGGAILVFLMVLGLRIRGPVLITTGLVCLIVACWGVVRDVLRRALVLEYDLDSRAASRFEELVAALEALDEDDGLSRVPGGSLPKDAKGRPSAAGMRPDPVRLGEGHPRVVFPNLDAPWVSGGRERLYFFPDRLLAVEGDRLRAIPYDELKTEIGTVELREDGLARSVPRETIRLRSTAGLNELWIASQTGRCAPLADALAALAPLTRPGTEPAEPARAVEAEAAPGAGGRPSRGAEVSSTGERQRIADPSSLKRGKTATAITERAPGWEYRVFALALIDVLAHPPPVDAPPMPGRFAVAAQAVEWAKAQLEVLRQTGGALSQLVNGDLPKATTPEAILELAWNVGRKAAYGRAWMRVVAATDVPGRFNPLREELARSLDQPLKALAAYGPELLAFADARRGGQPPKLSVTIQNQDALKQAVKTAMS